MAGVTVLRFEHGNAELAVTNAESVARELLFRDYYFIADIMFKLSPCVLKGDQ